MAENAWGNEIAIKDLSDYFIENGRTSSSLFGIHGNTYFFALRCEKDYLKAYQTCSPLKAIVAKRAKAFNSGKFGIVNHNTGKPATGRDDLKLLLDRPNVLQSGDQFFAQQNIYTDIFGYCPVLKIEPAGMPGVVGAIWNIPPWLFDLDYTTKWLQQFAQDGIFKTFYIFWNGERIPLDSKNLGFIFDDGIGTETDSNLLIPDSRLVSMEYEVSNIVAAYKSRNTLITKRGAIGILSNEAEDESGNVAMREGEKEGIQKDFAKYGLVGQPFQIIVTDAKLKWQQMGFPTSELMLFEEIEDDIHRLCDGYGYPPELIARSKDTTFDNKKQARKDFIENTIEPESQSRMRQFTRIVAPKDTIEIVRDYSKLTVFQEDAKFEAEILSSRINVLSKMLADQTLSTDEYRQQMFLLGIGDGKPLPPRVDDPSQTNAKTLDAQAALRGSVGGVQGLLAVQAGVSAGTTTYESGISVLTIIFGFTPEEAKALLGTPKEQQPPADNPPPAV